LNFLFLFLVLDFYCPMLVKKMVKNNQGAMLVMALVFTTLFTVMAIGITGVIASQHKLGLKKINWNKSLAVAEAGIDYYRWHLAHAPTDYQDGTGQPGPYLHDYYDNLGNPIGQFSLEITPPDECSTTAIIESTGWMNDDPKMTRTIKAKYGRPSFASFAFLTNSNTWFGETETLHGPLHSNGGIRMDGYNDAISTSAKDEYICGPGGDASLWEFPVSNVDFDEVVTDLSTLRTLAKNSMCSATENCYWGQLGLGWHIKFLSDGTFDMYWVNRLTNPVWGYDGDKWVRESDDIDRETYAGNYNFPGECGIIFVEDNLWIDGVVNGQVTVAAAHLPDSSNNPKIIINGDLVYADKDGNNSLGLIAQSDIYIPLYGAENDLEIDGALLAQKGHIFRKYYTSSGSHRVLGNGVNYILRDKITLYGSIMTNTIWTWSWVNSWGDVISGYINTETIYDPNLTYNPPPGFPVTGEYQILQWEETTEKQ
jgi:hypothetical protein